MHPTTTVDEDGRAEHGPAGVGVEGRNDGPSLKNLLVGGAVGAVGCAAIALTNPTDTGVPICLSQISFGVDCPLCGGLRCVNSLLHGNLGAAADHNVFAVFALPLIALWWVYAVVTRLRSRPLRRVDPAPWVLVTVSAVLLVFTIVRNVATSGWLSWLGSTGY